MKLFKLATILLFCILVAGCAAGGMKDVTQTGFLDDYSMLKPGGEDRAALVYVNKGTDFKPYNKIMFERVLVTLSDEAANKQVDPAVFKELTDYYQKALLDAIKGGYQLVDQPGQGVLRVRAAITGIKPSKPVSNTMSTILPIGWALAGTTKAISDDNLGTGEAATEIEVLDSVTGERLAAAVDRRQGGKSAFRGKWEDTKAAFDFWAKRFRERLDEARGM
ncbi:MAG: DUF3313 domain-containing protein [Desulfuromusa sp.]|nr:DUF3313 domain-containing protein [Desulfuromusa sp.]